MGVSGGIGSTDPNTEVGVPGANEGQEPAQDGNGQESETPSGQG